MKHLLKLSLLFITIFLFNLSSSAVSIPVSTVLPEKVTESVAKPSPFAGMTVQDFLALTPKKFRELTGKKMSLSQKISLKIGQRKVKKMIKNNEQVVDLQKIAPGVDTSDFSIGGFILGLLLPLLGVLIAYLIGDRAVIKWAWIGFAVWLAIAFLVWII